MPIVPADLTPPGPDGFAAQDRAIFAYGLVGRDWRGDPLAIEARYDAAALAANLADVGDWLGRKDPNSRLRGQRRLLPAIRAAFGLPGFAEQGPAGLAGREALALLDRFTTFQDRLRARYRREAELLVRFGPLPGREHTYEREVGLWLNRDRATGLAAVAQWFGSLAAGSHCDLPACLPDALAPSEAAGRLLEQRLNSDRRRAAEEARKGRPGAA